MRFIIKHEIKGRLRIHAVQEKMTFQEADTLLYYMHNMKFVTFVKVYERTGDAVINYVGDREQVITALKEFQYENVQAPAGLIENSGRALNAQYQEKLIFKVLMRFGRKLFVPAPIRTLYTTVNALKYIYQGVKSLAKGKMEVAVLDATAIGVSVVRGDLETAASIMFLLGVGELLEEWTHKKSVDDLARSMSLNVERVWLLADGKEVLVPYTDIRVGDKVVVHMGNLIPFDGKVVEGEAMINQVSLTGESLPARKSKDGFVYAGTVVEEGELTIQIEEVGGSSKFEKIVTMIEESEKLKSSLESKAEHLADRLVPYTLLGTGLCYLLTRNVTKALSILMVDFSCALKLAMPISVLSAIREASLYHITVKGGKYLEYVAEADTIVFDKTGTLTKAKPSVVSVISFNGEEPDELLRIAACIEEHFPHSVAKAVVHAAKEKNLEHEEMHSKVEYIVAHGISTTLYEKKTVIGSYHFVFEDEKCTIPEGMEEKFQELPKEHSHLYLAIENKLAAVICIEDPLREEAEAVVNSLRKAGIRKIVMMTGDSERTARAIAERVGVDEYYSEVLPEHKAKFIEEECAKGRKVIMVGDGINDSPALAAADVGIAISDGAEIAREVADITISADNLFEIVTLKLISDSLMKRISSNYRFIVGFNSGLILLGVTGLIQPTASALLHNTSTLVVSVNSMKNLLTE
ncbi:heavy metal translocating P-type ATPase [Konateibacter massiliensis]|uniref:heavy metal translocating P-type ATPase n=1 Tax=Konateibacter massiliensis TaxID=2002841 RepID=UPI000C16203F|nr:heavy metal translocating P-type ATPase [Konateibacter massiliensis]